MSSCVWAPQATLTAGDGAAGDSFGWDVALDGDTALVGAPSADDFNGAAYVFTRAAGAWTEQAKLGANEDTYGFGESVALSGDSALFGVWYNNAAYVFGRSGGVWSQQAKLVASDGAEVGWFGDSVALSGDTALVGARGARAAYVFVRLGEAWCEQAKLASSGDASWVGSAVALEGDTLLVGVPADQVNGDPYRGSAHVFRLESKGPLCSPGDGASAASSGCGCSFERPDEGVDPRALAGLGLVLAAVGRRRRKAA